MSTGNDKQAATKQRFLSPSYRKGEVKDAKADEDFKIDLMGAAEFEYVSPEKAHKKDSISSTVGTSLINLASVKDGEQEEQDKSVHPLPEGRVKKIGSLSQAGKGEDGFTKVNQDSFLIIQNEYNLNDFKIFSVLDGHGVNGHLVSRFATKYFTAFFKKNKKMNVLKSEDEVYQRLKKNNCDLLNKAFKHCERDLGKSEVDANFSGTTCVMVFQIGDKLLCSNIGDSRAILVKKDKVLPLSIDQKPNDPEEKKRIESLGGEVSQYEEDGEKSGPFRVWKKGEMYPGIAMSRSVGDLLASTLGVIPRPEFIEIKIDADTQFMVLASDGVWEFLENNTVADLVRPFYEKNDPDGACKALIKEATKWWNQEDIVVDDITTIIVFF